MVWKVVENAKRNETNLTFVTGCPRIPLDGFDPQFTVTLVMIWKLQHCHVHIRVLTNWYCHHII